MEFSPSLTNAIRSADRNVRVGTNVKKMAGSHFQIFNLDNIMTGKLVHSLQREGSFSIHCLKDLLSVDLLMQFNQTFKY